MPLTPGNRLGRYEIVSLLGAGGMGEVYLAKDSQLERTVAIKVLTERLADNPELRQRFEREARAVSSLNHPHICTLYDVGCENDVHFLVMEHLEGVTLAARLRKGALPTEEALTCAIQIADALDKAHRQGVVHRDLKPGNIMLTKSGAKLLDFGLAKQTPEARPSLSSAVQTESSPLTAEGTVVGTFQYMSPEQLEGKEADARTDLFSFGAVLYEMVTGKKAFEGKSQASLIAAIMKTEPPAISTLQPVTPPALDRVVQRCLAKEPDERWQTASDLGSELKWVAEAGSQAGVAAPVSVRRRVRSRIAWSLVVLLAAVSAFVSVAYYREITTEVRTYRMFVPAPEGAKFGWAGAGIQWGSAEISPDGRHLVMLAFKDGQNMLWVRSLDEVEARPLAGTEGAYYPFWSPDSRYVGFFTNPDPKLKKVPVAGGPALTLCDMGTTEGLGGAWSQEGVIVFADGLNGSLLKVPAAGGEPIQVTELDESRGEVTHRYPHFLPDGRHFLYVARSASPEGGVATTVQLLAGSIDSNEKKPILYTSSNAFYASGHLLFTRERTLMAHRFNVDRLELDGDAFPIAENVALFDPFSRAAFSVSQNGILAYQTRGAQAVSNLVWYERSGVQGDIVGEPADYGDISLSRDGTTAAISIRDAKASNGDLWMLDLVRGIRTRFTFEESNEVNSVWSPDGTRVVFSSNRRGSYGVFLKPADGTGEAEFVQEIEKVDVYCSDWSPDGQHLVCPGLDRIERTGGRRPARSRLRAWNIYQLSLSEDAEFTPLIQTRFDEEHPALSPDGRWLAYTSDESGVDEIYIRPFPLRGGKWQVSTSGGRWSRWGPNGKELFYLNPEGTLMVAQIEPGEKSLKVGQIDSLSQISTASLTGIYGYTYDVTPDGQRFLVIEATEQGEASLITVVVNWTAELEK